MKRFGYRVARLAGGIFLTVVGAACQADRPAATYEHYLHFFQIRSMLRQPLGPPRPLGRVAFTAWGAWEDLDCFVYVQFQTIEGHVDIAREHAPFYATVLDEAELDALYQGRSRINKTLLQRADIEKLHRQMILAHPERYPRGTDCAYGAQRGADGLARLDGQTGRVIPDAPVESYRQGRTFVLPIAYNLEAKYQTRLFWNLNNPTVREYAVRLALKVMGQRNTVFLDNVVVSRYLTNRRGVWGQDRLEYIAAGDEIEQSRRFARHQIEIMQEIHRRRPGAQVFANSLRDKDRWQAIFLQELFRDDHADAVDLLLVENLFFQNDYCDDIKIYREWITWAKQRGKKICFAATLNDPKQLLTERSSWVSHLWLWLHLVAEDNVYVYINSHYQAPMTDLFVYTYPLGRPLGPPQQADAQWSRRYERGTIVFDTQSRSLNAIQFQPAAAP
ncbi:MAG: hypothetical protein JW810_03900 [Sedimentisphaerales bacterium]|nr:hypothetical protein [Sedimentisphaerales bacterium]